jgi:hypothetical protein
MHVLESCHHQTIAAAAYNSGKRKVSEMEWFVLETNQAAIVGRTVKQPEGKR